MEPNPLVLPAHKEGGEPSVPRPLSFTNQPNFGAHSVVPVVQNFIPPAPAPKALGLKQRRVYSPDEQMALLDGRDRNYKQQTEHPNGLITVELLDGAVITIDKAVARDYRAQLVASAAASKAPNALRMKYRRLFGVEEQMQMLLGNNPDVADVKKWPTTGLWVVTFMDGSTTMIEREISDQYEAIVAKSKASKAPNALRIENRPSPAAIDQMKATEVVHALSIQNRPLPVETIEAQNIKGERWDVPRFPQTPPKHTPPSDRILGGDPRAPKLAERAKQIDANTAADPRFRGRLEAFLRLKPMEWMTWGDQSLKPVATAAQESAQIADAIQVANAPKWGDETRTAYQKGPSLFGRKPGFYQQMLENARDMLIKAATEADDAKRTLTDRLWAIKVDALVLQVATEGLTDAMETQIANDRLRTMLTTLQSAGGFITTLDQSAMMITKQVGDVQQLLSGLIPSWIAAYGKG